MQVYTGKRGSFSGHTRLLSSRSIDDCWSKRASEVLIGRHSAASFSRGTVACDMHHVHQQGLHALPGRKR